jgi:hypothetical protein
LQGDIGEEVMALTEQVEARRWAAEQARLHLAECNKHLDAPWIPDEKSFAAQADKFYQYVYGDK